MKELKASIAIGMNEQVTGSRQKFFEIATQTHRHVLQEVDPGKYQLVKVRIEDEQVVDNTGELFNQTDGLTYLMLQVENDSEATAEYTRPELDNEDRTRAENYARATIRKYGMGKVIIMVAALCLENVRLLKEINEHRAARGIDPLAGL